jgi:hypothetical protein
MSTPGNTNEQILRLALDGLENSGGGGGSGLPPVTAENAGEFLRVNENGKIESEAYPIKEVTTVFYNGTVIADSDEYTTNLTEYTGTEEEFMRARVFVNDERLYFNEEYNTFGNEEETIFIRIDGRFVKYIQFMAINAGTYNINIYSISERIDEAFKYGVEEIAVPLPPVTAADNTALLTVKNGAWSKSSFYHSAISKSLDGRMYSLELNRQGAILIINGEFPIQLLNTTVIPDGYRPAIGAFMITNTDGTKIARITFDSGLNVFTPDDSTLTGIYAFGIVCIALGNYPNVG